LNDKKYTNKIPCAYSIVFNKEASVNSKRVKNKKMMDTKNEKSNRDFDYNDKDLERFIEKLKSMPQGDIVGKYGEDALSLIEKDGDITKLATTLYSLGIRE
jgi:hypothetical protein